MSASTRSAFLRPAKPLWNHLKIAMKVKTKLPIYLTVCSMYHPQRY